MDQISAITKSLGYSYTSLQYNNVISTPQITEPSILEPIKAETLQQPPAEASPGLLIPEKLHTASATSPRGNVFCCG